MLLRLSKGYHEARTRILLFWSSLNRIHAVVSAHRKFWRKFWKYLPHKNCIARCVRPFEITGCAEKISNRPQNPEGASEIITAKNARKAYLNMYQVIWITSCKYEKIVHAIFIILSLFVWKPTINILAQILLNHPVYYFTRAVGNVSSAVLAQSRCHSQENSSLASRRASSLSFSPSIYLSERQRCNTPNYFISSELN